MASLIFFGPPSVIVDFRPEDFLLVQEQFPLFPIDLDDPLVAGPDPVATSDLAQFLYDTDNGRLYIDPDGTGSEEVIHIFTLIKKPTLTAEQIILDL